MPIATPFSDTFSQKNAKAESLKIPVHTICFTESVPFTFTGKERDAETGFSFYGARYYDPELSALFLSVDPCADKCPSNSPYAYCAWNPVRLVDPSGKIFFISNKRCIFAKIFFAKIFAMLKR